MTRPRGIVVFTHRSALWDDDVDGVRTSAEATRGWKLRYLSEPEEYMPLNPDPKESAKRIRYGVYEGVLSMAAHAVCAVGAGCS